MSEFMHIRYVGIKSSFTEGFVKGLVSDLLPGCRSVYVEVGKEVDTGNTSLGRIVQMLYNGGKGNHVSFRTNKLYEFTVHARPSGNSVHLTISLLNSPLETSSKIAADLVERCKGVYLSVHPEYAIGGWEGLVEGKGVTYKSDIFWLNFYGPQLVKKIGLAKLKTVPYGTIEELADSGVMLMRGRITSENSEHHEEMRKHLFGGKSLFDGLLGR